MPAMPTVSVVIPTFRGRAFVADALESVFAQTLPPCEVLVVDDSSPDGTAELAKSIGQQVRVPVHVLRLAKNSGGPARPINVGIAAASGELIAVCDQDDVFLPNRLEIHADILARCPSVSVAFGLAEDHTPPVRILQAEASLDALKTDSTDHGNYRSIEGSAFLKHLLIRGNTVYGYPGFIFRKADWARKGGLDETLRIASDYDLLCWFAGIGNAAYTPKAVYRRRMHEGNATRQHSLMYREMTRVRCRYARRFGLPGASEADRIRLMDSVEGQIEYMRSKGHTIRAAASCLDLLVTFGDFRTRFLRRIARKLIGPRNATC